MTHVRFMFTTHGNITEEQVRSVLDTDTHAYGKLDPQDGITVVDMKGCRRRSQRKFFIHIRASTAFYNRLMDVEERKELGETVELPRIMYGKMRDGTPMYWYVHLGKSNGSIKN